MRIANKYARKYESRHLVLDNNGYAYIRLISQKKRGILTSQRNKNKIKLYTAEIAIGFPHQGPVMQTLDSSVHRINNNNNINNNNIIKIR